MQRAGLLSATISIFATASLVVVASESRPVNVGPLDPVEHCTAFLLDNDGHGVFGANFDHTLTDEGLVFVNRRGVVKSSVNTNAANRRAHWTSRYASVSFNLVGYEYAWGGMNEAGLSISTMSWRRPASRRRMIVRHSTTGSGCSTSSTPAPRWRTSSPRTPRCGF